MGFIYLAISPKGKPYVGKTTFTVSKRMAEHYREARYKWDTGCIKLNNAIRKYGETSIVVTTLLECPNEDLDVWEMTFIVLYDSLSPNGYNLTTGGGGGFTIAREVREKQSKAHRKYHIELSLPLYIYRISTVYGEGFIVDKPNCRNAQFCSNQWSMEEKLELANTYLVRLNNGEIIPKITHRALPTYVYEFVATNGEVSFKILKPGFPTVVISDSSYTEEQKKERILTYLEQMNNGTFDRTEDRHRTYNQVVKMEPYVKVRKNPPGYEYRHPGGHNRTFTRKSMTDDERRDKANEYARIMNPIENKKLSEKCSET